MFELENNPLIRYLLDILGTASFACDLHFDIHFWMDYLPPAVYCRAHRRASSRPGSGPKGRRIYPLMRAKQGFWQKPLD